MPTWSKEGGKEFSPFLQDRSEITGFDNDWEPYWEKDKAKLEAIAKIEMDRHSGLDLFVIPVNIDL